MDLKKIFLTAFVAMLPIAIISCDKENDDNGTASASVDVTKVVGTYEGYSLASSAYFQNNFTPDENQDAASGNRGRRVGIAYELENGEIIYVPE